MKKLLIGLTLGLSLLLAGNVYAFGNHYGGNGGNADADATAIGVGVGVAGASAKNTVKNTNKVDVDNTNVNANVNMNRNSNKNTNVNVVKPEMENKQAQGQFQGQGQLQGQGQMNNWTQIFEDQREHARLGFIPEGATTKSDSRLNDPELWNIDLLMQILDRWELKNKMWHDLAIKGSYKTKVIRTAGALIVDNNDDNGVVLFNELAPTLIGFVTVTADDNHTSNFECLAEAMRIAAYELDATAAQVIDMDFKELNTTSGWTIGFNTVGSASGTDSGVSVGGGPGYSEATGGFESRPYVTIMVTR